VRSRTDEEVNSYRLQRQIHVYGEGVPKPCTTFEEASFPGGSHVPAPNLHDTASPTTEPDY
jgi:hypothetical protein